MLGLKEFVQAGWSVPSENAALSAHKIYFGWRLKGLIRCALCFFCGEGDAGERPCLRKEFVQAGWSVPSENAALSAHKIYFGWRLKGVDKVCPMIFFCGEGDAGERPRLRKEFVQAGWYVPSENAALSAHRI